MRTQKLLILMAFAMCVGVSVIGAAPQDAPAKLSKSTILKYETKFEAAKAEHQQLAKSNVVVYEAEHTKMYSLDQRMLPNGNTRYACNYCGYLCNGYTSIHAPPKLS